MRLAETDDRAYASECDDCEWQKWEDDGCDDLIPVCEIGDATQCPEGVSK